jgi:hypothetical protein
LKPRSDPLKIVHLTISEANMSFDFSCVDWSDDSSPFDQCDSSSSSCCDTVSLSSSSSSLTSSKSPKVRFAQEDEIFEIPHVKDFSTEDVQATWYRPDEFLEMRSQIQRAAMMMEERGYLSVAESDTFSIRGLEFQTEEGGLNRSQHKREATASVLEAQQRLWNQGRQDSECIAAAYRAVSTRCLGMALLRGIQDQYDVRDHVQSEHEPCIEADPTSSSPCKPLDLCSRRVAVLEDIKILSGASGLELWPASPAAA